jgi:outer membrane protein assembly factor BamD (BamD/ComL family)
MRKIFILFLFCLSYAFTQQDINIGKMLENINNGKTEAVSQELTSLLKKYPNNPGLMYVKAYMTTDGSEAVKIYNDIVQKYPSSEWADDALYRVYQYYVITDNTKLANEKLNILKTKYSKSTFIEPSTNANQGSTAKFYYLQLGAFSTQDRAQDFINKIKGQGYTLSIKQKNVNDKILYSVLSNKFTKRADAEKLQKDVEKKLNIVSMIISE